MYESESIVGERGQITIPKKIRDMEGIKANDTVVIKLEDDKIIVEKALNRKQKDALMKEYFLKYAPLEAQMAKDWDAVSTEADENLDDY